MRTLDGCSVAGIVVEGLFGLYDYNLGSNAGQSLDHQLLLLYGDNGCGKTTILRLLYHTLSPEPRRGHRTSLVKIPVRRFNVILADGTEVGIDRTRAESLTGPYTWFLKRINQAPLELDVKTDAAGSVKGSVDPTQKKQWDHFEHELARLGISIYFLPDDRKTAVDDTMEGQLIDVDISTWDAVRGISTVKKTPSALVATVAELGNVLRSQVIRAGQTGEENINQIYSRIVRRLLWTKGEQAIVDQTPKELIHALDSLTTRSEPFSVLGLTSKFDFTDLVREIDHADPATKAIVAQVLQPYVESITARLDALAAVQALIETLVRLLDSFYAGKRANFDMQTGLQITQSDDKHLPLDALSSGEKQLLLLFCNTIRARTQATIFIIDEPELSLNVKWQRKLLESLLTLVKGSRVQFVIATHSIELLAGQRDSIVRLNPRSSEGSANEWNDERSPS